MQAIRTKYIGPTDTKGARIKATAQAGSVTIPYPHEMSGMHCHAAAAAALIDKLDFPRGEYDGGQLPDGSYCFVLRGSGGIAPASR